MHIFGEIPFVKPQNDTLTDKRLKTKKNENEKTLIFKKKSCFGCVFVACSVLGRLLA